MSPRGSISEANGYSRLRRNLRLLLYYVIDSPQAQNPVDTLYDVCDHLSSEYIDPGPWYSHIQSWVWTVSVSAVVPSSAPVHTGVSVRIAFTELAYTDDAAVISRDWLND